MKNIENILSMFINVIKRFIYCFLKVYENKIFIYFLFFYFLINIYIYNNSTMTQLKNNSDFFVYVLSKDMHSLIF